MKSLLLSLLGIGLLPASELDFKEQFADPVTREASLDLLIPGTRDGYFYPALHQQLTADWAEYEKTMSEWKSAIDDKGRELSDDGYEALKTRSLLLRYETDPEQNLNALIRHFEIKLNHDRPDTRALKKLTDTLDPATITAAAFEKQASITGGQRPWVHYSQTLLLESLNRVDDFSPPQLRHTLKNLHRSDHPGVVALVSKGFNHEPPISFGHSPLHRRLTLAQLEQLEKQHPSLKSDQDFVTTYLRKRREHTDRQFARDREAHAQHLAECWDYARDLPPSMTSLRAHILHHHLRLQRELGRYPRDPFLAYLGIPRSDHAWLLPDPSNKRPAAKLTANFQSLTACPPAKEDESLIHDYLRHFLGSTDNSKLFAPFIEAEYLATLHAKARLLTGANPDRWGKRLDPVTFAALLEETRVGFAPGRPALFAANDSVTLDLDLKNATKLGIRIFELNHSGILSREGREPSVDMELEGLVPHVERHLSYAQKPLRLHRETINLPELKGAGVWIVEFVSEGQACRALIRKGTLVPYVERTAEGQRIIAFDESGEPVRKLRYSLGKQGAGFISDEQGAILIPNLNSGGATEGVLTSGNRAIITQIGDRSDQIELSSKIHLDREQLLADSLATARIALQLTNHGHPLPLTRIENATLTFSATLASGITTEHVISEDLEIGPSFTIPFNVPADTVQLVMKLSSTIIPRELAEPITETTSEEFHLNSLIAGEFTHGHFSQSQQGYDLELRGRNGEPLANRSVELKFRHRDYRSQLTRTQRMRTNEAGRIILGELENISRVTAFIGTSELANLNPLAETSKARFSNNFNIAAGEILRLPHVGELSRKSDSLTEVDLSGSPRVDHFDKLKVENDHIVIQGLAPGRYRFNHTNIEVSDGKPHGNLFVSADRIAPRLAPATPVIDEVQLDADSLGLHVVGASEHTRVHLIGARYLHPWDSARPLEPFIPTQGPSLTPGLEPCSYLTDRTLDDETRYILERRAEKTFPGSMLPRPGMLIHRWTPEISNSMASGGGGGAFGSLPSTMRKSSNSDLGSDAFASGGGYGGASTPDFLDYLSRSSKLHYDLQLGEQGHLTLPLADFDGCQLIRVIVTDHDSTHRRIIPLPESPIPLRDRRLTRPLDPKKRHVGVRRAAVLRKGAEATITNVLDADWRAFTTLAEAHEFLYGATGSEELRDLIFLTDWPSLDEQEKVSLWTEHASHEIHLFLSRKDRKFFDKYVAPMLREKREPQFLDDYLLKRDLKPYLRPYAWNRLNAAEKALLAQALPAAKVRITGDLGNRWTHEAPSPERETQLFAATLRSTDLATKDSLGIARNEVAPSSMVSSTGATYILQKLRSIIIPNIHFEDVSIEEAIDFLRLRSIELDHYEIDPEKKGMSFVIRQPRRSDDGLSPSDDSALPRIQSLKLRNVPVSEVLNYLCEATRMRWSVDEYAITIKPATEVGEDVFTRTFNVSPDFLTSISDATGGSGDIDPFAPPGSSSIKPRMSIVEALKANGVAFPEGSSASFFASNGTLLVRGTPNNLDLVEQIVSSLGSDDSDVDTEGLLPPIGNEDPFASTTGRTLNRSSITPKSTAFNFVMPQRNDPVGPDRLPSWSSERAETRLWMESNYYRHLGNTDESLIPLNAFWLDLARWNGKGRFLSPHFNACTNSSADALLALALLDLPFTADRPEVTLDGATLQVQAKQPMLLFYKDTRETDKLADEAPVLVRQTFHRLDDRFREENGRRIENSITGDFRNGIAYGASLVVTNPTGAERRIDVLAQIPEGAIALNATDTTLSETLDLEPYGVLTLDLAFYFPASGQFTLYPMQVAEGDTILATAPERTLRVVATDPEEDRRSWQVLARDGTNDEILQRLRTTNLYSISLQPILWRLRDKPFFDQATTILRQRLYHDAKVNAYGFLHADLPSIRTWLENSSWAQKVGSSLSSPLLTIDPVTHHGWQTLEFDPLVNPRRHAFSDDPRFLHPDAQRYYDEFLDQMSWTPRLRADDQLNLTWFLFMQDRIGEALARFEQIKPAQLGGRLPYDYLHALALFHQSKPNEAKAIALNYTEIADGPWRIRFDAVIAQADEIEALSKPKPKKDEGTESLAPQLKLALAPSGQLLLDHQDLRVAELDFYQIDLEILFSQNPFLKDTRELPATRPNLSRKVKLTGEQTRVDLPEAFHQGNILVSAQSGSTQLLEILDSEAIELRHSKSDQSLRVTDSETGRPLSSCYVKVYLENGSSGRFHKDGYTDLRGRFDLLGLKDGQSFDDKRIAVFVHHPEKGSRTLILAR